MFAAGRAVDDQNARRGRRVFLPPLGGRDRLACFQPLDRKIVVRVGEAVPGFHSVRRLAVILVAVPRRVGDSAEFFLERLKGGVVESRQKALFEFRCIELDARHAFAGINLNHGGPSRIGPWLTSEWPWCSSPDHGYHPTPFNL